MCHMRESVFVASLSRALYLSLKRDDDDFGGTRVNKSSSLTAVEVFGGKTLKREK